MADFTFIDLFAGIGGTRTAFSRLGGKCVFSSEWNSHAQKTYEANYGEMPHGDINLIEAKDIPDHDILIGGFPCQPFSLAGVSKKISLGRKHGFEDAKQGNLFFEIVRILEEKRPGAFMLENVKNLKSHDKGRTFEIVYNTLTDLGYKVYTQVIDARDYVPQHRERVFIIGFDKDVYPDIDFSYPEPPETVKTIAEILEKKVDPKYTITDNLWAYLQKYAETQKAKGNGFGFGLVDPATQITTRTLSARYYKDGAEILIKQKDKNPRRLTPRECARLMGFDDDEFKIVVSDSQAYKQFGNSIVVPVVEAVGGKMLEAIDNYEKDDKVLISQNASEAVPMIPLLEAA